MTKEKIILTPETYENVSRMLNSPDEENAVVALSAMEEMDFKSCKMYMALLYKESYLNRYAMWEQNAPNLLQNVKNLKLDEGITLTSIFLTLEKEASEGELQVYANKFRDTLAEMLKVWGFGKVIPGLNISITVKPQNERS